MWAEKGRASFLVGGQFGSEGKGLAAAWLADRCGEVTIATTNAGAQAGHTTKYLDGRGFVCFHLPTVGVVQTESVCYINAGSIIDPKVLFEEMETCHVHPKRLFIHPRAAVITNEDRAAEKSTGSATEKLASTQKGVGSAISRKVMRKAVLAADVEELKPFIRQIDLNYVLSRGGTVTVEVPQGHDLSINHGFAYPYCTSRDCWVGSGLSDAGIHPSFYGQTAMVVRTFPIRVGAVHNELGEKLGESGPFYSDSQELQWSDFPGVVPERTTVTKRVRRIATWSDLQYRRALSLNRPSIVFLNFINYLKSADDFWQFFRRVRMTETDLGLGPVHAFGLGPEMENVLTDVERTASWLKK